MFGQNAWNTSKKQNQKYSEFLHDLDAIKLEAKKEKSDYGSSSGSSDSESDTNRKVPEQKLTEENEAVTIHAPKPAVLDFAAKKEALGKKQLKLLVNKNVYDVTQTVKLKERGVIVHPDELSRGEEDVRISIVEQSHY